MKVSLIVLFGLLATTLLRKQSAAVRHWVLAAALVCAAATPALRLVVPAWQTSAAWLTTSRLQLIDRPMAVFDVAALSEGARAAAPAVGYNAAAIARWLRLVWIAGASVSLFVLLAGLGWLSWLASRATRVTAGPWAVAGDEVARRYELRRPPVLLQSEHLTLLVTWGFRRPKVLLPADAVHWPDDRIRIVLGHELAHIRRGDWLMQTAATLLRAAYWFNPLVWVACRRLRLESEQACDDAVLELGVEGSTYATELVDLARKFRSQRQVFVPAAAIARPSSLERRVRAMLNVRLNRNPITRRASLAAAIVLAAVTVLVAGFGAAAQSFSTVSGTLADQFNRGLAGATVMLANPQAQSKYEIKTDANGRYEFVGVPPGSYVLTAEHPGFAAVKREGVVLSGQAFQQDVAMRVGSLQETITVTDVPDGPRSIPAIRTSGFKPGPCTSTAGGSIRPPAKTKDVRPIYPSGAKGGLVSLDARIGEDGLVSQVDVAGEADSALANAAITAVNQWQFTPTLLDCQPIEVRMKVSVSFVAAK